MFLAKAVRSYSSQSCFFVQFKNTSSEQNVDSENVVNSRYFDIDEMQALKLYDKKNSLSFFPYKCMLIEQKL